MGSRMSFRPSGTAQDARVDTLVQTAFLQMRERRLDEAAQTWNQVLLLAPEHAQALLHLGQHHLYRKDPLGARRLLERAAKADPLNPVVPLNLAFSYRATGDSQNEMVALTRSLTIDPYFFPALLAKGMLLERSGANRKAAKTFKDVLTIAPPEEQLTGEMQQAIRHAREVVERNSAALDAFLGKRLDAAEAIHADADLRRFAECRDIAVGKKKIFTQKPSLLYFPRLPAIPFYEKADFPWLKDLEAATGMIRGELLNLLREDSGKFQPYVSHPAGAPIEQWAELNNTMRWTALFLWKDGQRVEENCRRCPRMAALLDTLPMIDLPNFGPTVLFSVLEPHTHIPPHSSVTNARLVVHLPVIVPKGCRFRVGAETRDWREGEAWVFDDTLDHEAWNDSDEKRVIVMIDIWNPLLTMAERALVSELLNGMRDYYSTE
jgi:aspartyl/asparaginyl beta-hydroxylase (cupin superfamily)